MKYLWQLLRSVINILWPMGGGHFAYSSGLLPNLSPVSSTEMLESYRDICQRVAQTSVTAYEITVTVVCYHFEGSMKLNTRLFITWKPSSG
jgi:hypothetical protein